MPHDGTECTSISHALLLLQLLSCPQSVLPQSHHVPATPPPLSYRYRKYCSISAINPFLLFAGDERPQVRRVLTRVHAVGQPEEAHAHPQQRQAVPVSRLFQELYPEADPQDAHDCPPACKAFQMQGESLR